MPKLTLKAARINKGLTQEEAANILKISVSTLKNWENGKSFPKQPMIEALCKLYGVEYDILRFV